MRNIILGSALAIGLLPMLMHSPSANADFITKKIDCPVTNATLLPVGSNISIEDIVVSTNKNQRIVIKYMPANLIVMTVFLKGYETVVSNFQGNIEGDNDQAVRLDCSGTAATVVWVTLVGNGSL